MIGAAAVAGALAGFVLGLLGAGGTVVGLPVLLFLGGLRPHLALGSNALGVALVALALVAWRLSRREVVLGPALVFTVPGLAGIYLGARLGLVFPGNNLISLLGILLFVIAGWLAYASTRPAGARAAAGATSGAGTGASVGAAAEGAVKAGTGAAATAGANAEPPARDGAARDRAARDGAGRWRRSRAWLLGAVALVVGAIAGFFAIGGGFMIVPALAAFAGLELMDAAATALLPVALFAGWVGVQYWLSGSVAAPVAVTMLPAGIGGGLAGGWLGRRLSKTQAQRIFAVFLVLLGVYMLLR